MDDYEQMFRAAAMRHLEDGREVIHAIPMGFFSFGDDQYAIEGRLVVRTPDGSLWSRIVVLTVER